MPVTNYPSIKLFADGAEVDAILDLARNPLIKGFTTNPTLMRKAGVKDYRAFAREVLAAVPSLPISFEVLADDFAEMRRQALEIASWAPNVYVKIPITNTRRESSAPLVRELVLEGVKVNVTAVMTLQQVDHILPALTVPGAPPSNISVFAGRIADTGRDPEPLMAECVRRLAPYPHIELIWASPREVLNLWQAARCGCHIITATSDVLKKLLLAGKDLDDYSLETVEMFANDAAAAGFSI